VGTVTGGQSTGVTLSADRTYTLTCTSASGSDARQATVMVAVPPVIAGFTATPSPIPFATPTSVTWTFSFAGTPAPAPTCAIEHGVGAVTSGQSSLVTLTQARTYRLTCSNVGGSATADATVAVDECGTAAARCDARATCADTVEAYTCTCGAGYTGDGFTCSALAACGVTPGLCDPDASCVATGGGPACVCDPGFVGDGLTCDRLRLAFTTSSSGTADLSTWAGAGGNSGLAAADAVCQSHAVAAGLPGTYVAWLSDATSDAYCRAHGLTGKKAQACGQGSLPVTAGSWARPDGRPVAARIDSLLAPNLALLYPPSLDESGAEVSTAERVWSATDTSGVFKPAFNTSAPPCSNWIVADTTKAITGRVAAGSTAWTDGKSELTCASMAHLRCLEIGSGAGAAVPATPPSGRRVFLTSTSGNGRLASWADAGGLTGLAAADSVCRARARAAGFAAADSFKAWMSTASASAAVRVTAAGPWSRLDGVVIAADRTDLLDSALAAPIQQDEVGTYVVGTGTLSFETAWTGTLTDGTPNTYTCNSWVTGTSGGTYGGGGHFEAVDSYWTWAFFGSCNGVRRMYCFED
jgi:hypothetical protein